MRIAISIVLLVDLIIRSFSIKAFFTDDGILPLDLLLKYNWHPYYFSFHTLSGELWWQITLFIINAVCIITLLIGYRTKAFTFICWTFLVSLQNRNPFILQGGDDLLRIMLLWGIFLPWGERYSIDEKKSTQENSFFSLANFGYLFLIFSVYFFSALLKTSDEWRTEGTAIYYALSLDQIRMPLGSLLYKFPTLMQILTYAVFYIELIIPIFFILPFVPPKFRLIGIFGIALLHVGICSTLYVGLFYIIGLSTLIGAIPSSSMDWMEKKIKVLQTSNIEIQQQSTTPTIWLSIIQSIKNWLTGAIIIYCLVLNLSGLKWFPFVMERYVIDIGKALRLEQNWGMFAPFILKDDGWLVYSGFNKNQTYIDIMHNGKPSDFTKPDNLVSEFESDRWRKFSENYVFNNNNYIRPYYCRYLLKKWNHEHPENKISELNIFFMKEISLPDYKTEPLQKLALCNCHEND